VSWRASYVAVPDPEDERKDTSARTNNATENSSPPLCRQREYDERFQNTKVGRNQESDLKKTYPKKGKELRHDRGGRGPPRLMANSEQVSAGTPQKFCSAPKEKMEEKDPS